MEALNLPLREIEARYTLSEVTMMAWRSQEQGYQMRVKTKPVKTQVDRNIRQTEVVGKNEQRIRNLHDLAEKFEKPLEDEDGFFTVKKQSGEDAARFLSTMGWPIAPIGR